MSTAHLALRLRSRPLFVLASILFALAARADDAPKGKWVHIDEEDGIDTWMLEIPGKELPGFRGRTTMKAMPEAVLAEIAKVENHTEWMYRCSEARELKRFDADHTVVYNRTDSPWPAWDRDVVLETEVDRSDDGKRIELRFWNVDQPKVPVPHKVVRIPRLVGSYLLEQLDAHTTRVTYTIELDVGGSLPTWLAKRLARDMPYETLSRLRERVQSR